MIRVPNLKTLRKITTNNKLNELALVEENRAMYKWNGNNWQSYVSPKGIQTTIYEINKAAITGLPPYNEDQIKNCEIELTQWRKETNNKYYMLLSNDEHYYTVIIPVGRGLDFGVEIIECLSSKGIIKSIDLLKENNSYECWITHDNNSYVYYLFPYDEGVIECQ